MEPKVIAKQMIDFQRASFDNAFNAVVMFQNQAERMTKTTLDQMVWIPEEGRKAINEWAEAYKKGRDNFKEAVDDNFQKVESLFSEVKKTTTRKKN